MPHANTLANGIETYAATDPADLLDKSFLLLGCFPEQTPQYQAVRSLLDKRAHRHAVDLVAQGGGGDDLFRPSTPRQPDKPGKRVRGYDPATVRACWGNVGL